MTFRWPRARADDEHVVVVAHNGVGRGGPHAGSGQQRERGERCEKCMFHCFRFLPRGLAATACLQSVAIKNKTLHALLAEPLMELLWPE